MKIVVLLEIKKDVCIISPLPPVFTALNLDEVTVRCTKIEFENADGRALGQYGQYYREERHRTD